MLNHRDHYVVLCIRFYLIVFFNFSALTLEDEVRAIGNLTNGFIRSISFGRDFEQQLSFYVEARANFSNIEQVIVYLVQVSNMFSF